MRPTRDEQPTRQPELTPEDAGSDVRVTDDEPLNHRRDFLTKSAAVLAVLGAAGLAGIDSAEARQKRSRLSAKQGRELQQVLDQAISTGDIDAALTQKGRGLPKEVSEILRQLNVDDLKAAAALSQKLARLRDFDAAANNGGIGM